MMAALRAEWTKLRTTTGPVGLLLLAVILTGGLGVVVSHSALCTGGGCGADPTRLALSGVYLGQVPVAVLAVLVVSGEYSTTLIRSTLTAIPNRPVVLAAKALVLAVAVAATGSLAVLGALLTADGGVPRAGARAVGYLVLVALLSLGLATVVRDSAVAIGTSLGLLYLPPILAGTVGDPHLRRLIAHASPMTASLGVLTAWSAGALLAGTVLLSLRDT